MFGEFVKELRARQRIGLREFCREHGHDPSNWSKIEREVLAPPRDEENLHTWAKQLGVKQGSEDWQFFQLRGRRPGRLLRSLEPSELRPIPRPRADQPT